TTAPDCCSRDSSVGVAESATDDVVGNSAVTSAPTCSAYAATALTLDGFETETRTRMAGASTGAAPAVPAKPAVVNTATSATRGAIATRRIGWFRLACREPLRRERDVGAEYDVDHIRADAGSDAQRTGAGCGLGSGM